METQLKDRERSNGNTTERPWKIKWKHNWKDRWRLSVTLKDRVAEGRWDRNKFYSSDPKRPSAIVRLRKAQQTQQPIKILKDFKETRLDLQTFNERLLSRNSVFLLWKQSNRSCVSIWSSLSYCTKKDPLSLTVGMNCSRQVRLLGLWSFGPYLPKVVQIIKCT